MLKRIGFAISVFIFLSVLIYHCETDEPVIAQVGKQKILKSEYLFLMQRHFPRQENYQNVDIDRKKEILERLIQKKLRLNAAYELGLDKDQELIARTQRYRETLINRRYHEVTVLDQIVPESEIEKYLNNQKIKVNASHILISFKGVNPIVERSREEALQLSEEISAQLENGAEFSEVARKYSDDPSVQSNGGNLGEFTWGQMVDPFQNAVWGMDVGEIRGPVETRYGFHIIKLNDRQERKDYNLRDDEETRFEIKQRIFSMRADSGRAYWLRFVEDLKDKKNYHLHTMALSDLSGLITENLNEGDISPEAFRREMLKTDLASWEGGSFTLDDLIELHEDRFTRYIVSLKQIHNLRKEVDSEATKKLILDDAIKKNLDKDKFVIDNVRKMSEERLEQMAETHEIQDKVQVTDEEAYNYYKENSDKFEKPAEIEMWEIFCSDMKTAEKVLKLARSGSDFESLARKYSQDKMFADKGGYLGFRGQGSRGPVSAEAFEKGSGEIGGPVKYRNGWVVFKTGKYKESEIRPFDKVKNRALSLLRRERIEEKRQKWEQNLRSRFTIVVNEDELKRI